MRCADVSTPVLFLTVSDGVPDRGRGLQLGADDCLVKPFAFAGLLARVRTLLRRGPVRQADVLRLADLKIDLQRNRAVRAGRALDLLPKDFLLLSLLLGRSGEVLSRTLIGSRPGEVTTVELAFPAPELSTFA